MNEKMVMVIDPANLKMLGIFLQSVLRYVYLSRLIHTTSSGQFTGQLLLACFCVFQALNSMYEQHQHTISANCLCLGCLIYIDAQDHI